MKVKKGRHTRPRRDEESNPTFRAENLAPQQGLSIVVTWPKGLIAEPTAEQKRAWFIADNKSTHLRTCRLDRCPSLLRDDLGHGGQRSCARDDCSSLRAAGQHVARGHAFSGAHGL